MLIRDDTIVAVSTPPGRGAIAVIRLSGPDAHRIVSELSSPWPGTARQATLSELRDPRDGSKVDRGLVTRFDAPRSYTGEPMVEIACHGGVAVSAAVMEVLTYLGARQAEPGEFTQRAVLNGKFDLLQAEAVADLVDARTGALRRLALAQLDGGLSAALAALRDRVLRLEALIAYDIDFPEEDDGPIDRESVLGAANDARREIERLLTTVPLGEVARDGAIVVIAGSPNAGKSSLFNALLGETRAIVTEFPGTTRDALEARVESGPWPLRLIDTAGLRETSDVVERLGIEVSERYLRRAHLMLVCGDSAETLHDAMTRTRSLGSAPRIAVRTKSDLDAPVAASVAPFGITAEHSEGEVRVSAVGRTGLDELLGRIHDVLARTVGSVQPEFPVVTRARHRRALESAREELTHFVTAWERDEAPAVVAAVHVRSAGHALDELIGSVDVEDVLERVFSTFCVGK
jgi:tRNA modification GTPase